jgi:hypothetical protein
MIFLGGKNMATVTVSIFVHRKNEILDSGGSQVGRALDITL